ncbi:MAG TPA: adenylate kinase [Alphaproteobacteria bacterium]|nr:adenylate kinase [Alphaproteobacteria bacterium]
MIIVFMGPPGAGKGTQAQILQENLQIPKLSTGDMLRAAITAGSEVGKKAEALMKNGDLVPDEVVVGIIKERIIQADCATGFILDGFPRTINQAQALDKMLKDNNLIVDKVICLDVNPDIIVARQAGRRIASKSGCVYHVEHNPPKVPGKCDVSGEDLIQRDDDKEDVVRHRLEIYADTVKPILEYYESQSLLHNVKGTSSVEAVKTEILSIINQK